MARTYITSTDPDATREYFDMGKAETWYGQRQWNGENQADINVGANAGQNLHRTAGGRWVLHTWSSWVGSPDHIEWATDDEAREWLLFNDQEESAREYFGLPAEERGPGRPEIGARVCVRLGDQLAAVDSYAEARGIPRADAVRQLVEQALTAAV